LGEKKGEKEDGLRLGKIDNPQEQTLAGSMKPLSVYL
jgi:hypothetical protein